MSKTDIYNKFRPVITGIGITSAIGQGKDNFLTALLEGQSAFSIMSRPGRQYNGTKFIGAEIPPLSFPEDFPRRLLRTTSFSEQTALVTLSEAWNEAQCDTVNSGQIGLIVGGSNFHQRHTINMLDEYKERFEYIKPTYGFSFLDSDVCGLCSGHFGIMGLAYPVGGASASGQLAIIQAIQTLLTGQVDVCIALGGLMDLSCWELKALRSLGAMGTDRYGDEPMKSCRPFDKNRDGFIFGEACGAVVIESAEHAKKRRVTPCAKITGWSLCMDGNRNPNPSYDGEVLAVKKSLAMAGLTPRDIDYVNPHGTASPLGDETELKALKDSQLTHAYINATKSVTGHGLSAAGAVEIIATVLQMKAGKLHPSVNLDDPIDPDFNWVQKSSITHSIKNAISLSMGFGGINTALCLQNPDDK